MRLTKQTTRLSRRNLSFTLPPSTATTMSAISKQYPISSLPLAPSHLLLPHNLTPDSIFSSPTAAHTSLTPAAMRRSRLLSPEAHFSYVTPLPLPFPYEVKAPEGMKIEQKEGENRHTFGREEQTRIVEGWLSERESRERKDAVGEDATFGLYYPPEGKREGSDPRILVGLSKRVLEDLLPRLDVGDAFSVVGTPSLTDLPSSETASESTEGQIASRKELVDVLSGHAALLQPADDPKKGWAPWSLRYSGHQFGVWAGQLGDGRAVSIHVSQHPGTLTPTEIQLKGVGRTPFSRTADGLAVLRSSVREFLGSEALHALRIPSTRALSLISLPSIPVIRERNEKACVVSRVAPSFLRIGNFEALSPPPDQVVPGGQQAIHPGALYHLARFVAGPAVLNLPSLRSASAYRPNSPVKDEGQKEVEVNAAHAKKEGEWVQDIVLEVASRNSEMVAMWQAYGFMHGVMNTDNISLLGLTIDYGPYAFMDIFDSWHICNHTDQEGRYSFKMQPSMIIYALRSLLRSLSPLIGAHISYLAKPSQEKPFDHTWADGVDKEQLMAWANSGEQAVYDEMIRVAEQKCSDMYGTVIRKRLGLVVRDPNDERTITRPFLEMMETQKLDYNITFRLLSSLHVSTLRAPPSEVPDDFSWPPKSHAEVAVDGEKAREFARKVMRGAGPSDGQMGIGIDRGTAEKAWEDFLGTYLKRVWDERDLWVMNMHGDSEVGGKDEQGYEDGEDDRWEEYRKRKMKDVNPRFVLRQWVLEEIIAKLEKEGNGENEGRAVLAKILEMASRPFEPWGAEESDTPEDELDEEVREERRMCEVGEKKMLGFQCSCSS